MQSNKDYMGCCLIRVRFWELIGEIGMNYIENDRIKVILEECL
jgi:hypothetical protein